MTVQELGASVLTGLLFEEPGVGRCLVAPDGSVLRANEEWLRSTGFALDEVLGANIIDLFPETRDMALAMHARARAGHRVEVPRHAQRVNGRDTWWEGSIAPVPMEGGTGLLITAREVSNAVIRAARGVTTPPTTTAQPEALRQGPPLPPSPLRSAGDPASEFLDNISDAFVALDPQWRYTYVNRRAAELLGKSVDELLGQCPWELFPFTVGSEAYRACHRAVAEQVPVQFVTYVPDLDRWFDYRLLPSEHGLSILWSDITESKRTKEAHKAASERLAQDLDAMTRLHRLSTRFVRAGDLPQPLLEEIVDAAISITHADMGNIQLLDAASRRLKVAAYRGHEKWWLDFFESVAEGEGASCGSALQQGTRVIVEDVTKSPVFVGTPALEVQLRAGVRAVQSTPLIGSSGDLVGMISTHYRTPRRPDERELRLLDLLARQAADMIERVRSEGALRHATERELFLADVLENATTPFGVGTPDGRLVAFNRAFAELTGYSRAELEQRSLSWATDLTPPEWRDKEAETLARSVRERTPVRYEKAYRRKDGSLVPIELFVQPIFAEDGALVHYRSFLTDITERKRAEEKIAADLAALTRIHAMSGRVVEASSIEPLLQETMDAAVAIMAADKGTLQLLERDTLRIVAHCGHAAPFLDFFAEAESVASVCGEATRRGERVLVPDVETSPIFAGTASLPVLRAAGVRAVQSTPMRTRAGRLLGILTTHWREPHTPDEHDVWRLDLLARQAADLIERKQGEEALRDSESRYRMLFQHMLEGFAYCQLIYDQDGRAADFVYLDVNDAFEKLTGLRDVVGKKVSEVIPGVRESEPELFEHYGRVVRTGHPERFEIHFRPLARWLSISVYRPRPDHFVAVFDDITERKRAEEAISRSEQRFRALADSMPQLAWTARPDGYITWYNRRWYEFTGTTPEEMEGWGWQSVHDPATLPAVLTRWKTSIATGVAFEMEFPLRGANGKFRDFLTRVLPVKDQGGNVVQWFGTNTDVTELLEAQEAVRKSEQLYRAIGESIDYGVWVCAPDGRNTYASESFLKLVGLTQQECSDFGWGEVLHPDDADRTIAAWKECVRTGGDWDIEHRFRGVDGKWHPILARGVPVRNGNGEIVCWAGINLDISRMKDAEEALREANRRKDEFMGMLSHELRNPLAPIRNSVYILRRIKPGGEQATRAQDVIERQTEHLTRLVDDLLDVTRIARGKIELRPSRVDLREVVERAGDDYRLTLRDRGVSFDVVVPDVKLWGEVDPTRITQVVGNLLHNASKFTRRGDSVTLSLMLVDGEAEIRVRDTGTGIEPELLPTIFEPFVQGDRTLARTEGGLGLGLALVRGITELHGGKVHAESAGKGKGTEVVLRLPVATRPGAEDRTVPVDTPTAAGCHVLVVDDHPDAAESLGEIVTLLGHTVEVAYDGPSALEKARAKPPDVVLCDIGLPGMSGYDVAKALREILPNGVQLIAVSGYAQPEDIKKAVAAGFDHHLAKPADAAKLERLLKK